jgi:hypothetical protein
MRRIWRARLRRIEGYSDPAMRARKNRFPQKCVRAQQTRKLDLLRTPAQQSVPAVGDTRAASAAHRLLDGGNDLQEDLLNA